MSLRLHHAELGSSGPRIAFLHGLFGQGRNWMAIAKALSDTHRVVLVDLPDHGRSEWSDHFSYVEMADSVGDLLVELSGGNEAVTVVGHSMGGKVAMTLALRNPRLVERLCVVDISPVRYARLSAFADYVEAMRSLDLARLTDRASADAALQPLVPDGGVRAFLLQNLRREGGSWRWQMNLQLLGDNLDQLADWPQVEAEPYPGPVLWIAGARSEYVRPDYADTMRRLFPQVRLVTVKNAGHWVHSEQPEVVVAALRMFVDADR
ncbi:alpha/beta fold hydrolase [Microlunatus panaciterrae]|uniref:Pimeloyl-ACP methyl ester carboxylesterase n=1 Tax=Microlunatus panaciterrae TaxID=400768 RepID=A0ABS2REE4_9ACTN|nr:alpha/beta fold hydrolase [Microlunatus panaciterrae]MBM7797376.1 pimeloyl-ACP methyl ester carboxylesterase [Microlunatus panaciterrae]